MRPQPLLRGRVGDGVKPRGEGEVRLDQGSRRRSGRRSGRDPVVELRGASGGRGQSGGRGRGGRRRPRGVRRGVGEEVAQQRRRLPDVDAVRPRYTRPEDILGQCREEAEKALETGQTIGAFLFSLSLCFNRSIDCRAAEGGEEPSWDPRRWPIQGRQI